MHNKPVIVNIPALPVTENNLLKNIIILSITYTLENTNFTLSADYIKDCFKYISNLNEKGEDYMKFYIDKIYNYCNSKLCNLVRSRFAEHFSSFQNVNINNLY